MKLLIAPLLLFISLQLQCQIIRDKVISIDPYLSFQYYEHFKRLTLSSPNSPVEYLDGFDFYWGYKYELNVQETDLIVSLSDGTQFLYSLNHIVSKTKMPDSTQFKLYLEADLYYNEVDSSEQEMNITFKQINDSTYLYFDEVEIEVPNKLRNAFKTIVDGKSMKNGTFIFIDDKRIRLIHL